MKVKKRLRKIRTSYVGSNKNPAEIVKLCESTNKPFPIIRNGYDELYVMSCKEYLRRKAIITFAKNTF